MWNRDGHLSLHDLGNSPYRDPDPDPNQCEYFYIVQSGLESESESESGNVDEPLHIVKRCKVNCLLKVGAYCNQTF